MESYRHSKQVQSSLDLLGALGHAISGSGSWARSGLAIFREPSVFLVLSQQKYSDHDEAGLNLHTGEINNSFDTYL